VAPAEWRLLGWLEREGFDYDYYAETQLQGGQLDLKNYRVVALSTHPEYWSHKMYERLKRWVFEEGGPPRLSRRQRPELRSRVSRRPGQRASGQGGDDRAQRR
jgi:hypothetical protein